MNTDYILIKRMRRGDEQAFNLFIHKYYEDILRYCMYHCLTKDDAMDLTQDTFLRFFSGFSDYTHKGKAKNYLYTIAGNLCKNHNKKIRPSPLEFPEKEVADDQNGIDFVDRLTIRMCVDGLDEDFREVIILYYYQGLKQTEIADVLSIGLPLVKYRLKKAKELLKEMLGTEG